jgi:hypothetical protein
MRRLQALLVLVTTMLGVFCSAAATPGSGVWALHYAGWYGPRPMTCNPLMTRCWEEISTRAPEDPGAYDIYMIAAYVDLVGIARTSVGLETNAPIYFYGWSGCGDSETATAGWPGDGEGVTVNWDTIQTDECVTIGVLTVYSYGASHNVICTAPHPALGYGEHCDASEPQPICYHSSGSQDFGCMGFGYDGFDACHVSAVNQGTWGVIKALYK